MIYIADNNWSPTKSNPFELNGEYGDRWSAFVYDFSISTYSNIYENSCLYTLSVNPLYDTKQQRLCDFIKYEIGYGRNVIIQANGVTLPDETFQLKDDKKVRESDPKWMVHSTTEKSWESIRQTGALFSPIELKKRGIPICEIGLLPMLEPKDYSDYIMLDILDGCGELVVNSHQLGYVCTNPHMEYKPGVRLYFDAHKIIQNGLAVRDGLHILKVKNKLSLAEYMVMAVNEQMLKPECWTPTSYTENANNYFLNRRLK